MWRYRYSILLTLLFVWGYVFQSRHFEFGKEVHEDYVFDTTKTLDTTGILRTSPFGTEQKFLDLINNAQERIYIQSYLVTNKKIINALQQASIRSWIDIKMMIERKPYQSYRDDYAALEHYFSGTSIELLPDTQLGIDYLHAKLTIIDDAYIVQTANLTASSFTKNREHFLYGIDTTILSWLTQVFLNDWYDTAYYASDLHPNIVICPINCRAVVEWLLSSATQSIVIQTQYITDPSIMDILKEKSSLDMQIVVADVDSNDAVLKYFGPDKVKYLPKPYVHTKMILIDDKILLVGSMNMSANSLDENREIGLLTLDAQVIQNFLWQFATDRKASKWRR